MELRNVLPTIIVVGAIVMLAATLLGCASTGNYSHERHDSGIQSQVNDY